MKKAAFVYGRFENINKINKQLLDKLITRAKNTNADPFIFMTHTTPATSVRKEKMKMLYPKARVVFLRTTSPLQPRIRSIINNIRKNGDYMNIEMVALANDMRELKKKKNMTIPLYNSGVTRIVPSKKKKTAAKPDPKQVAAAQTIKNAYSKYKTNEKKSINRISYLPVRSDTYVEYSIPGLNNSSYRYNPNTWVKLMARSFRDIPGRRPIGNNNNSRAPYDLWVGWAKDHPNYVFTDPYTTLPIQLKNLRFVNRKLPVFSIFWRTITDITQSDEVRKMMGELDAFMRLYSKKKKMTREQLWRGLNGPLMDDIRHMDDVSLRRLAKDVYEQTNKTAIKFVKETLKLSGKARENHSYNYVNKVDKFTNRNGAVAHFVFLDKIADKISKDGKSYPKTS